MSDYYDLLSLWIEFLHNHILILFLEMVRQPSYVITDKTAKNQSATTANATHNWKIFIDLCLVGWVKESWMSVSHIYYIYDDRCLRFKSLWSSFILVCKTKSVSTRSSMHIFSLTNNQIKHAVSDFMQP